MNYYLIGTGNMAWFLGTKLFENGHTCVGVYGRSNQKANQLANAVEGKVLNDLSEVNDDADACIIAITDDAIEKISKQLSLKQTTLLHTSGAKSIDTLSANANNYGVLWPIYSINKSNIPEQQAIPTTYECNNNIAEAVIKQIAASFTNTVFKTSWLQRSWLHVAAVMSNNFVNHLITLAETILKEQGIPVGYIHPIIKQTIERINETDPYLLQTGPAKRNDVTTINAHLALLAEYPQWHEWYKSLSASITTLYKPYNDIEGQAGISD